MGSHRVGHDWSDLAAAAAAAFYLREGNGTPLQYSCLENPMDGGAWYHGHQAPPSMGFSRQEYWSGLPFPSPMHESEK